MCKRERKRERLIGVTFKEIKAIIRELKVPQRCPIDL